MLSYSTMLAAVLMLGLTANAQAEGSRAPASVAATITTPDLVKLVPKVPAWHLRADAPATAPKQRQFSLLERAPANAKRVRLLGGTSPDVRYRAEELQAYYWQP